MRRSTNFGMNDIITESGLSDYYVSPPGPQALWEHRLGYFHTLLYLSLLLNPSDLPLCGKNYFICDKEMGPFISNFSLTDNLQTYKT